MYDTYRIFNCCLTLVSSNYLVFNIFDNASCFQWFFPFLFLFQDIFVCFFCLWADVASDIYGNRTSVFSPLYIFFSSKVMSFFVKISKFEKNFNMPGKIHFLIIRHVIFVVDLFWSRKWIKSEKILLFHFLVQIFWKMPYKPLFLLKIK